jgi:guanylate kinase
MTPQQQRSLIIISAPSGTGKSTVIKRLLNEYTSKLSFSVSSTTREPRAHEIDGVHYYFLSKKEFEGKKRNHEFLETEEVHGNCYGTSINEVERIIDSGKYCLLDIDVKGAMTLSKLFPYSKTIFILPPSLKELKNRLVTRGDTPQKEIKTRLSNARGELEYIDFFKYKVFNHVVEDTVKEIASIIFKHDENQ